MCCKSAESYSHQPEVLYPSDGADQQASSPAWLTATGSVLPSLLALSCGLTCCQYMMVVSAKIKELSSTPGARWPHLADHPISPSLFHSHVPHTRLGRYNSTWTLTDVQLNAAVRTVTGEPWSAPAVWLLILSSILPAPRQKESAVIRVCTHPSEPPPHVQEPFLLAGASSKPQECHRDKWWQVCKKIRAKNQEPLHSKSLLQRKSLDRSQPVEAIECMTHLHSSLHCCFCHYVKDFSSP